MVPPSRSVVPKSAAQSLTSGSIDIVMSSIAGISLLIWRNDVLDWLEQEGAPLTDCALTGTIIGMARALGESDPLLMIGMVAFIVDIPGGFTDPSTVLPVQIYLWADSPERAFVERTSAATIVLLAFLITMNALAVILRKRFEKRW